MWKRNDIQITFIARFLHASKAKKVTTFVKITEDDKLIYGTM